MHYFIDSSGNRAIDEDYIWASSFSGTMACVKHPLEGVCFIDRSGQIKIRLPSYQQDPTDFHDQRILVSKGRFFGFTDISGKEVIQPSYLFASSFSEGVAPVQLRDGFKYTFIDPNARIVSERRFRDLRNLHEGLAVAENPGVAYYVDREMRPVLGPFEKAETFWEGMACVVCNGDQQYIDKSGAVLFRNEWDWISGLCFEGRIPYSISDREGFLDKGGNVIIPAFYKDVGRFSEGIAIVGTEEGKMGIDTTGRVLFQTRYEWIGEFREGVARFRKAKTYGFIDRTGNVTIPNKFGWAGDFSEGLAPVSDSGD